MNRSLPTLLVAVAAILAVVLPENPRAQAQSSGYQAPSFYSASMSAGGSSAPLPPLPASPLAGGLPAAGGDAYMDAHGQPIVLQASYCQSCPGGYGDCGPGGYVDQMGGDPMAVDFGGCGFDQCGPHYFDVSTDVVFLQGEDLFQGVAPFGSIGIAGPLVLDPESDFGEYEPGWQIAFRYDLGPLSVLEATYMGLYDISFKDQVNGGVLDPNNPFVLFSPYSDYGTGTLIDGIDNGVVYRIDYQADLQSTEFSYRRYWLGHHPCISGTYLLGARYFRFTDDFVFNSQALVLPTIETAALFWSGENDLVGFQFGGDAWACVRQGLRIGCEGKAGVYNNRFKFRQAATFSADSAPNDFDVSTDGNQVAFAAEGGATVVADILPSWSLRGGYRVFYLSSLATAENNINQTEIAPAVVSTQGDALYHGFHGGLEYVW